MLIGLSGYAGSGKDTVANTLIADYGFTRLAFADPIREFLTLINPILTDGYRVNEIIKIYGWDVAKSRDEVRRLMQDLGVGARKLFGNDFWIRQLDKKRTYLPTVITDVRFLNEVQWIKNNGGQVWRVHRPGVQAINKHISETELDGVTFDHHVINDAGLEDIKQTIKILLPHNVH